MNAELQNAPGEEEEGRICDALIGVAADPPCCGQESCCGALVCRVMLTDGDGSGDVGGGRVGWSWPPWPQPRRRARERKPARTKT